MTGFSISIHGERGCRAFSADTRDASTSTALRILTSDSTYDGITFFFPLDTPRKAVDAIAAAINAAAPGWEPPPSDDPMLKMRRLLVATVNRRDQIIEILKTSDDDTTRTSLPGQIAALNAVIQDIELALKG